MVVETKFLYSALIFLLTLSFQWTTAQDNGVVNTSEAVRTVVIDAGHGGRDPGCIGRFLKEKDVALFVALKLGEFIKEAYPDVKVLYTRDNDVFVNLDERAKIANDNEADLFISIHANAASPSAYGTETFVLGLHRSESQQKVAERENATIHYEEGADERYADFDMSPDAIIARQIQLSVFLDQSIAFADKIQKGFGGLGRKDRGVKQAGFIVLYKTTVPSVLVEVGFLTNRAEENYLRDSVNQIKIANSLFKSFQEYKNDLEGVERLIKDGDGVKEAIKGQKEETVEESNDKHHVVFRVQIATSSEQLKLSDSRFGGQQVWEYKDDGFYKYTTARTFESVKDAKEHLKQLDKVGFENAFVVAFDNAKRISISEAKELLK